MAAGVCSRGCQVQLSKSVLQLTTTSRAQPATAPRQRMLPLSQLAQGLSCLQAWASGPQTCHRLGLGLGQCVPDVPPAVTRHAR